MTTEERLTAAEARGDALEAILMAVVDLCSRLGNTAGMAAQQGTALPSRWVDQQIALATARGITGDTDLDQAVAVIRRVFQADL
jgi:hypothetical protein